jgi:GDP-L-fucose synthase
MRVFDPTKEQNEAGEMFVNVGVGQDVTIRELAEKVREVVGFEGSIVWETSKPDGTMQKMLDVSKIHTLGWTHSISLDQGLRQTYDWYREQEGDK